MRHVLLILSCFVLLFSACSSQPTSTGSADTQRLVIMAHDSFAVNKDLVKSFEDANHADIVFLQSGDAGAMLNKAILTKDAPLADVLFGVDNTFLSRALEADIFEAYDSPALQEIPEEFKFDPSNRALPVDYGDVCINYDKSYFAENDLPVPQSLEELTKPEYKGLLVVENPATSSTGLAFLAATVSHYGDAFPDFWRALKENEVVVVDGWETAYYTHFSGSSGQGSQPMVVSYASSPAAEVILAETPLDDAPTASIIGPGTCFRQLEFVGILKGTDQRALAEKFVDFMLGKEFQEDMPLQMFVYPVNQNAALPEAFVKYAQSAESPVTMPSELMALNRDKWIQTWTDVVLK
ncbi:MAG TPA: thiamine ABC transporter substrate-binding protein [Anaerolineales bacterium]|nr:thiamine ABC transporter substrate-binding protein [Anaerolineales bacterium]